MAKVSYFRKVRITGPEDDVTGSKTQVESEGRLGGT